MSDSRADTASVTDAAEARASLYDGDDRQDIKTDVLNAFYAGVKFASRAQPERKLTDAEIHAIWQHSYQVALQEAGFFFGNGDVAHMRQPVIFARALLAAQPAAATVPDYRKSARIATMKALILSGHKFDWPYTDAFDDGGVAYRAAAKEIDDEKKASDVKVAQAQDDGEKQ